jgi:hypothetical protein
MIQPNAKQLREFMSMSQLVTSKCFPLHLVRMDERTHDLFIAAGNELEIIIDESGEVYYDQTLNLQMDKAELRDYVLKHRQNNEAFYKLSDQVKANAQPINASEFIEILQRQSTSNQKHLQ